jgi:transposase
LAAQFLKIASKNELLSLTSFVVLLSFSALSFNWCRVSPSYSSEKLLNVICSAGVDSFIASLLALVAAFFAWLQTMNLSILPSIGYPLLFVLHFSFILLSLLPFLTSIFEVREDSGPRNKGISEMSRMVRKRYSEEFKRQVVELVRVGKPVAEVAEEFGIGTSMLYRWVGKDPQSEQVGSEGQRAGGEEPAADELRRLRREIGHLKMENDILKKAAVILGTKAQPPLAR